MKLNSFCIDRFGGYSNVSINKINPGFTLFYGENESGKTTLKNFFQQMLFGFAKKNSKFDKQYIPFDGTVPSGNLSFVLSNENQYLLSRLGNKTNLVLPDTSILNSEPMTLLWNSITKETFRQVFCMDIQDWNGLSLMDKEEMQNRFLSSSLGLNSLIKSTKQLKTNMDGLWKKQGRSQVIHEIDKKIKAIDKEIKSQEKLISEYKQWGQDLFELEDTLNSLKNQKGEINSLYNEKLLLNEMKPDWVECNIINHKMKLLQYNFNNKPFSVTSIEKARKLEDEIRALEERNELEATNCRKFVSENNSIAIEEELILKQNEINSLVEKKNQFIKAIQDEPKLSGEIELEKIDFIETLNQIDPKWSTEILQQICIPIDQKSLVKSWKTVDSDKSSEIKAISIEIQKIKEGIDSKTLRITNLVNRTKDTETLTNDEFYLTTNTIKTLKEYESHREIVAGTQWKTKNTYTKNIKLPFGVLIFGIVLFMLGIIGANISTMSAQIKKSLIFLDVIGFFSIVLFFFLKQYSFKSFQETSLKDLNEEIRNYRKDNPLIKNYYKDLQLTDLILFLQKKLDSHSEKYDVLKQTKIAISNLDSDIKVLNNSLSVNKEKLSTLLEKREVLQKKWTLWKANHFIQNNFSLLDYAILFSLIDQAQSKLKNLLKSEYRLKDLSDFIVLTKTHIEALSTLFNTTESVVSLNPEAISTLQTKLSETLSDKRKKLSLKEKIQTFTKQIEETRFSIGIKQKQLKKIFLETETITILELESKTEAWISHKSLNESYNLHMNRLYGKISNDNV
ncbi:MAG: AAA family ATPase, partial [Caldisericia bacterium]|nr:AAA family ATPase [Caldisericia bacterium]